MKTRILGLALAWATLAPITHAASLTIVNFDFETGGLTDGNFSGGTVPTGWSAIGSINSAAYGYFNPTVATGGYVGTDGSPGVAGTMSGANVFYFGTANTGEGIQQTLSATFAANTDYTLTVAIGSRPSNSDNANLDMRLFAGTTLFASGTFRNTAFGTFADFSLNYTANATHAALAGQALKIQLIENDTGLNLGNELNLDIDNIRLDATASAIPEPSTYTTIFGVLALGAAAFRRRQARA